MYLSNYYIFVTTVTTPPPKKVNCGDGQKVNICNECPANEEGCTSDDCKLIGGKCEPGMFYLISSIHTSLILIRSNHSEF